MKNRQSGLLRVVVIKGYTTTTMILGIRSSRETSYLRYPFILSVIFYFVFLMKLVVFSVIVLVSLRK